MASACATVTAAVSAREAYRQLVGSAIQLVFAEAGFVCIREGHGFLRPLASTVAGLPVLDDGATSLLRSAFFSGECLTADGRVPWAPDAFRELLPAGAVAAIPGGVPPFMVLALVRSDETPFVAAELDRLAALVRVASGTLQLHSTPTAQPRPVQRDRRPVRGPRRRGRDDHPARPAHAARSERLRGLRRGARRAGGRRARGDRSSPTSRSWT